MTETPNHTPERPDENPKRVQLTQEAARLITGQRQEDYGPPEVNFKRVADYWSIRLREKLQDGVTLTPREVAEMLLLLKVARATQSPTEDSYVDGIGYTAIAGELAELERIAEMKAEEAYHKLNQTPEQKRIEREREEWIKYCRETGGDGK